MYDLIAVDVALESEEGVVFDVANVLGDRFVQFAVGQLAVFDLISVLELSVRRYGLFSEDRVDVLGPIHVRRAVSSASTIARRPLLSRLGVCEFSHSGSWCICG